MAAVFQSATRTQAVGTYNSNALYMPNGQFGALFRLNISAIGTTPTLDIKFQYYDTEPGTWEDLLDSAGNVVSFAQKTGTGEDDLMISPGVVEKLTLTNRRYAQALPWKFRVVATVGDAGGDTITFSLSQTPLGG